MTFELWLFADEEAAEEGEEEIDEQATDPEATGGAFSVRNGVAVALFGCTCEADSYASDAFADLDLSGTGSDDDPDDPVDPSTGEEASLEDVLEALEDAGLEPVETGRDPSVRTDADEAAVVEVSVDGEEAGVEVFVLGDAEAAEELAEEILANQERRCGGECDEVFPVPVVNGNVVLLAEDTAGLPDLVGDFSFA